MRKCGREKKKQKNCIAKPFERITTARPEVPAQRPLFAAQLGAWRLVATAADVAVSQGAAVWRAEVPSRERTTIGRAPT